MSSLIIRIIEKGPTGVARALRAAVTRPLHLLRVRGEAEYSDPDESELARIEQDIQAMGIRCVDYRPSHEAFMAFKERIPFPSDYHGGAEGGIHEEKLLEHFVAWDLLELACNQARWPYIDVASASSPWAKILREKGHDAFSIDLEPHPSLTHLDYYMRADATSMPFDTETIGSASLQCAYEMFTGDADIRLMRELARILRPGGRAVISPLYTHTHPCYYQSPEYFGRPIGDPGATSYVRRHARGVPASRKYSAQTLHNRVWDPAIDAGLSPGLLVVRNKASFGPGIYLHFILTLDKPKARGRA